jgi:phage shock protein B
MDTGTIAVIMVFAIPLAAVIGGLGLEALKVLRTGRDKEPRQLLERETELVQQMRRDMDAMRERIETLESLLIKRERERPFAALRNEASGPAGREID